VQSLFAQSSLPESHPIIPKIKRFSAQRTFPCTENLFMPDGAKKETWGIGLGFSRNGSRHLSAIRCPSFLFKSCSYSVLPFLNNFNRLLEAIANVTNRTNIFSFYAFKSCFNWSSLRSHISGLWLLKYSAKTFFELSSICSTIILRFIDLSMRFTWSANIL